MLNQEWKNLKNNANTENVLMTISEIVGYYKRGRININPSYQRNYRWSNEQKTKFIESLLLKYPIPPIISIKTENENGLSEYEIIDGVQRLSTIFEFVNAQPKNGEMIKNIKEDLGKLEGANTFLEINGKDWADFEKEQFDFIFESSTLLFTNFTTNTEDIKYEMFERLNSLSSQLSRQEIRNSIIAMKDPNSFNMLSDQIYSISKPFISKPDLAKRIDLEFFVEFSLIKRYNDYKEAIEQKIIFIKDVSSKNKDSHFDIFLSSYVRLVKIEELIKDIEDYKSFIALNEGLYFKKFDVTKDQTSGRVIKFFFELLSFLYFKNKDVIDKDFYQNNFAENYADIMKNKLGKNNPNARIRFEEAKKVIEGYSNEDKLF
jgi:predicted DNA-binding protein